MGPFNTWLNLGWFAEDVVTVHVTSLTIH